MPSRSVTYLQGVALYMGGILGSGILILPGYTAEMAGPASVLSWLVLSLLSVPLAFCFARLALRYNHYGGLATIVEHAFGRTWSAIVGWFFMVWVAVGQAVVGLTGAGYLVHVWNLPASLQYLIAFLFLVFALCSNLFGMQVSGRVSLSLSVAVLLVLVATILFSLSDMKAENFEPFAPRGFRGVGEACVLIFWAYFGWESVTHLVPEFRNPERDVMRSMWTSLAIIGGVYVMLSVVTIGTGTYGTEGKGAPLALLMSHAIGFSAAVATALVACIVCLGTLNVFLASSSRLGYAMALESKFPGWVGRMDKRGTPSRSMWLLFATNSLAVLVSWYYEVPVDRLILVPTTLGIFVYVISAFACVRLLREDKVGRISALLAAISCLAVTPFAMEFIFIPAAVALVCVAYLHWRRRQKTERPVDMPSKGGGKSMR